MPTISARLERIKQNIAQATTAATRPQGSVKLLAVSKTKPVSDIMLAYAAGQRFFGENYVQEGIEKIQALQHCPDIEWHFIGPLQSNKTRQVAEHFHWVQTLDRLKIARRLNDQCGAYRRINVCIQVNIDEEETKAGVLAAEVAGLAQDISALPRLTLRGLMAIPAANASAQQQQQSFTRMRQLFEQLAQRYPQVDTLSMGMSDDMVMAIRHGSTMVRLGSAIFGSRQ